jgi:hypothetical protein
VVVDDEHPQRRSDRLAHCRTHAPPSPGSSSSPISL